MIRVICVKGEDAFCEVVRGGKSTRSSNSKGVPSCPRRVRVDLGNGRGFFVKKNFRDFFLIYKH
jgi:hypothetical protein